MNPTVRNAIGGIGAIVIIVVGVWLVRPLFTDTVVDEALPGAAATVPDDDAFPMSAGAVVPDGMTPDDVEAEMAAAAGSPAEEAVEPMPGAAPVATISGAFVGADSFHQGEGSATVYELEDGSRVLRLEDFSVTNGPDLHVYLAPIVDGVPVIDEQAVDLGQLKGNVGNQNYDIPGDLDLDQDYGVVIWCVPFRVTFATALLA